MPIPIRSLAALAIAALVLLGASRTGTATPLEWSIGVKGGGGADLWFAPDDPPEWTATIPLFRDDTVGWGYGGGLTAELRLFRYLAFEIDVLLFRQERVEETAWKVGPGRIDTRLSWLTLCVPILIKGVVPLGTSRLWLGVGPELSIGLTASASTEVGERPVNDPPSIVSHPANDIYFLTTLGAALDVDPLILTVEARVAYNVTEPGGYAGHVDHDRLPSELSLRASSSLDLRLLVGFAYDF